MSGDNKQSVEGNRKEFAGGYSRLQRFFETGVLVLFFGMEVWLQVRLWPLPSASVLWLVPPALLVGFLAADFLSGAVHWFCDTWGSISWPIVGQSVLRTFREHHFDQKAITHHDFVETNGSNGAVGVLLVLCALAMPARETAWGWAAALGMGCMAFFVLMTSQIHKWAHTARPPSAVRLLQRCGLILSPRHHAKHHAAPFTHNYCITAGWLNPIVEHFRLFPRLERLITLLTGVEPRHDPLSDQLVAEVLRRHPPDAPPIEVPVDSEPSMVRSPDAAASPPR